MEVMRLSRGFCEKLAESRIFSSGWTVPVAGKLGRKNNLGGESGQKEPDGAGERQVCRKAAEGTESLIRRGRTQKGGSGAEGEDMHKSPCGGSGEVQKGQKGTGSAERAI